MKKLKLIYGIVVFLFVLFSIPPLTILVGLKIFCTESFFSLYLEAYSVANIYLVIVEGVGLVLLGTIIYFINKKIEEYTKPFDDLLEKDNKTVIKAYDKYRLEYSYLIPTAITFFLAILSYEDVFSYCGTGLLLLIFSGVIQAIIAFIIFYNDVQFIIYMETKKEEPYLN